MSADSDAYAVVQKLPGLTPGEQQYLLTVARGEGFYGLGWSNASENTIRLSEQFGIDPKAGVDSNNWGAVQGTGNAGSFPHVDHHADGSPYVGKYKRYLTSADGAVDMARILLKPNVKAALAVGDLRGAVFAQHSNRYFELAPEKYLAAVKRNYGILTQNLQWPVLLSDPPPQLPGMIAAAPLAGSPSSALPLPSSGAPSASNRPKLYLGCGGKPVRELQNLLVSRGHSLMIDGKFGPKTLRAVRHFQSQNGLVSDGIVGPLTWNKLL
jgi:hypothetical protein